MIQPLISVIVPCYNVEKYLEQCVESVVHQTYKNLEIWLVDDGSPDRCGLICDEWQRRDRRIKVIHKKNGGLSDARNAALDVMTGEYVTFIDSDDFVTEDYVERLVNQADETGADIVVTGMNLFYEGNEPRSVKDIHVKKRTMDSRQALVNMMYQQDFDTAACGKLYRSALFKGIRYPLGFISEDLATTYRLLLRSKLVAWNDYPGYNYLLRKTSIEGSGFTLQKYNSYLQITEQLEFASRSLSADLQRAFRCRIVSLLFHLLLDIPRQKREETEQLWQRMKHYRTVVLLDRHARTKARLALLASFGGMKCIRILSKYASYRKQ